MPSTPSRMIATKIAEVAGRRKPGPGTRGVLVGPARLLRAPLASLAASRLRGPSDATPGARALVLRPSRQPAQQAPAAFEGVGAQAVGGGELGGEAQVLEVLDQQVEVVERRVVHSLGGEQLAPAGGGSLGRNGEALVEEPAPSLLDPQGERPGARLLGGGGAERRLELAGRLRARGGGAGRAGGRPVADQHH